MDCSEPRRELGRHSADTLAFALGKSLAPSKRIGISNSYGRYTPQKSPHISNVSTSLKQKLLQPILSHGWDSSAHGVLIF